MKVPTWFISLLVASAIGLEAWTLLEILSLNRTVAGLSARVELLAGTQRIAKQ